MYLRIERYCNEIRNELFSIIIPPIESKVKKPLRARVDLRHSGPIGFVLEFLKLLKRPAPAEPENYINGCSAISVLSV